LNNRKFNNSADILKYKNDDLHDTRKICGSSRSCDFVGDGGIADTLLESEDIIPLKNL